MIKVCLGTSFDDYYVGLLPRMPFSLPVVHWIRMFDLSRIEVFFFGIPTSDEYLAHLPEMKK